MANAFTKKYLTDLIVSRLAALNAPNGHWSEDEKRLIKLREEDAVWSADDMEIRATSKLAALSDARLAYSVNPTPQTMRDMISATNDMGYVRSAESPQTQEIRALEEKIRRARNQHGIANPDAEKARLERVKEYITESPDDEFSFTLMRTLGFIDIIKKAING